MTGGACLAPCWGIGESGAAAGFGYSGRQRALQAARQPQQSIPVLLRTAQPCFLLLLRLLEGKIRFAFCSASLTESLAQQLGEEQNLLTVPALWYWLS